jgi:hypothetical protein
MVMVTKEGVYEFGQPTMAVFQLRLFALTSKPMVSVGLLALAFERIIFFLNVKCFYIFIFLMLSFSAVTYCMKF